MTELLYLDDSYMREFSCSVMEQGSQLLSLTTRVFPGGGGQPPVSMAALAR
jgi:Ser-tRNA(Ala) deacylase AlaX